MGGIAYVSNRSISESIDYFRSLNIRSGEQLGLFFFFKSIGFSDIKYHDFSKVKGISEEERKAYLKNLYNLSAIFDENCESGEQRCCLFPFSICSKIGRNNFFNPGTPFNRLLSRIRDTVDNTLVDKLNYLRKDDLNPDLFKFPHNYLSLVKSNYLKGVSISLVYFSAWYFRFRGIEIPDSWNIGEKTRDLMRGYTRVCVKIVIDELKLTEEELDSLFYCDLDNEIIDFSLDKIDGRILRSKLYFDEGCLPEVEETKGGNDYMEMTETIKSKQTEEFALPTGDNIKEEQLYDLLVQCKQVILYGVPGTGKSHYTNWLKTRFDEYKMVQFHANTTYEQFIGGVTIDEDGNLAPKEGVFLKFCKEAEKNDEKKYLFIIDEINRGNVSKVFGEVILTLDREYSVEISGGVKVDRFTIPDNVYIVATMNSADRSIAQIDYAIRRRFAFVKFYPNYELIATISDNKGLRNGENDTLVKPDVLLKNLNKKIFSTMKDENMLLGQAYFIPKWAISDDKIQWTPAVLQQLFNYYILPIIEEYTYGNGRYMTNILGSKLPKRIENTDEFMEELKVQFF